MWRLGAGAGGERGQHYALAVVIGESGVGRLSSAGEIVTEGDGHAWIGAPIEDTSGMMGTTRRANILALYEAQMAELRTSLGERGLQRLLATGNAE